MSHAKPFASSAARDTASIDTEEMQTDELIGPDGSPLLENTEDLFEDPSQPPAEPRTGVPEAKEEDTQIDEVPTPDDAVVVDEDDIIGELPPPSDKDIDLSVGDIVARAERTDDFLRRWRTTSVDRKEDWEVAHAKQLELEAQKRGWFYLGAAGGVVTVLVGFCGLLMSGAFDTAPVAVAAPSKAPVAAPVDAIPAPPVKVVEPVAEPVAAPAVVEAVVEAPKPVEPEVATEPEAATEPSEPVAAPEPVAEPTRARVVVDGRSDAGPTVLADGTTWTEGRFRWAGALVAEADVELAWFDAAGREVLDRVACAGRDGDGYRCLSGRSPKRISWALSQGAVAGLWTVKACQGEVCTTLGTTQVD